MSPILSPARVAGPLALAMEPTLGVEPDRCSCAAASILAATGVLVPLLSSGTAIDARALRAAMETAFCGSDADGLWVWKDAYEAAEVAAVLMLRKFGPALCRQSKDADGRIDPSAMVRAMEAVASLLPSHTRRSEESQAFQQFSTPLPIGAVAAYAAAIQPNEFVLEPSAGTGMLAIHARMARARLILNELAATRAELVETLYDLKVTRHDAAQIHDRLARPLVPSVVLMNPPFSVGAAVDGRWREATLAHMRSALQRLAPGGRLVAVTGSGFAPDRPSWRDAFVRLQEMATLRLTAPISGRAYARHGTTTETRLTVFDKVPASEPKTFPDPLELAENASALLRLVRAHVPPRVQGACDHKDRAVTHPSSFRSVRRSATASAAIAAPKASTRARIDPAAFTLEPSAHRLDRAETAALAYTVREVGNGAESSGSEELYADYVVGRIAIDGCRTHPTTLVQSTAMASVLPPIPSYRPLLPIALVRDGLLSDAQLESVVYAGEAHSTYLSGRYTVDRTFDRTDRAADDADPGTAVRFRRGWFLGDGTGAGKGRQVAGVIMDNWLNGRRRAVWVSKSDKLIEDAVRDWTALGGAKSDVVPLSGFRQGSPIGLIEGILFTTYATLRSQSKGERKSRVEQIVDWLQPSADEAGDDGRDASADPDAKLRFPDPLFDGCIVFDESHAMANAASSKGARGVQKASQQGLAGLRLQNALPDARVLYVSATGATQVSNLAYAARLGLWSTGDFPFASREDFVAAMEKGGVAAMEVISRDLKSLGLYAARSLSYDGVEYDTLCHELTPEQREIYDSYADAFQIIHQNLDAALEATGITSASDGTLNAQAKSAARSAFESNKQRFFNHLLVSMKCPSLIRSVEAELANGHACVVQVVSTGEALVERRIAEVPPSQWSDLDVDITPREYVLDYLMHSFPTQLFEPYTDDEGELRSRPARDADGNPITCRDAEEKRDALIEHLGSLPAVQGAMDQLIWHFGKDAVAEVTGRSRRIVRHEDGRLAIEARPASANYAETNAFMDDEKNVLIFSDAGGTGRSYHADLNAVNRRKRVHYLLEPGWKADSAIQGLGRTNRTNQAQPPLFRLVTTDVKGERRFISTIARRLDTLGAITKGQRQTGGGGMFTSADNLESPYARAALRRFFHTMVAGRIEGCSLDEFEEMSGLSLLDQDDTIKEELPAITQFLNRMLALRIEMQNRLFDAFGTILDGLVDEAMQSGAFDVGVETLRADRFEIIERKPIFAHASGAEAIALTVRRTDTVRIWSADEALAFARNSRARIYVNARSGRAAVVTDTTSWTDENGVVIARVKLHRPQKPEAMTLAQFTSSEWTEVPWDDHMAAFAPAWAAEADALPTQVTDDFTLVTGLLLPIWDSLPADDMKVWRVTTHDGETALGRTISKEELTSVLRRLGHEVSVTMTGVEMRDALMERGTVMTLAKGTLVRPVRQMGERRIEIVGAPKDVVIEAKGWGCFTEVANWKTRLFVPLGRADTILSRLVARLPIEDLRKGVAR